MGVIFMWIWKVGRLAGWEDWFCIILRRLAGAGVKS